MEIIVCKSIFGVCHGALYNLFILLDLLDKSFLLVIFLEQRLLQKFYFAFQALTLIAESGGTVKLELQRSLQDTQSSRCRSSLAHNHH